MSMSDEIEIISDSSVMEGSAEQENIQSSDVNRGSSPASIPAQESSDVEEPSPESEAQRKFDSLSTTVKLKKLDKLVQTSRAYSQIILENMMEKSLQKKQKKDAPKEAEPVESDSDVEIVSVRKSARNKRDTEDSRATRKKRRSRKKAPKKRDDSPVVEASEKTKATKKAIELAQTGHNQVQPSSVTGCTMKDYQLDGLEWLATLYENGLNGILADEMGLGKTLQCISLFCHLADNGVKGPFLVVVPLSTAENWMSELRRFAPSLKVVSFAGRKAERAEVDLRKKTTQVVITTYEVVIRDPDRLMRVSWRYLIVDEGHRLKNSNSVLIQKLKRLRTDNRLLLTGTPLQNNLKELWSLLNFILPDIFQDADLFEKWLNFDELKASAGELGRDELDFYKATIQSKLVENLHATLKPFILRRLKKDVIKDLPPKKEYVVYCSLSPLQNKLYQGSMKGKLPETLIELYAKESLLQNHGDFFRTPEDLQVVDTLLSASSSPVVEGKRARRSRYTDAALGAYLRDIDDNEPVTKRTRKGPSRKRKEEKDEEYKEEPVSETYHGPLQPVSSSEVLEFVDSIIVAFSQSGHTALVPAAQHHYRDIHEYYSLRQLLQGKKLDLSMASGLLRFAQRAFAFRVHLAPYINTEVLSRAYIYELSTFFSEGYETPDEKPVPDVLRDHLEVWHDSKEVSLAAQKFLHDARGELHSTGDAPAEPAMEGEEEKPKEAVASGTNNEPSTAANAPDDLVELYDAAPEIIEVLDDDDLSIEEQRITKAQRMVQEARKEIRKLGLSSSLMQRRQICASHYTYYDPVDTDNTSEHNKTMGELIYRHSGKMQMLEKILMRLLREKHKVLIFSQFTGVLDLIEYRLAARNITFSRLDGTMNQEDRVLEISDFSTHSEEGNQVFLLSTRAGGLGLNLIHADTVILFDNDWNPQMDLQAIDRVHRIGQTKPVKVIRFVVKNSVEELLIMRSFSKRALERMVIQQGKFGLGQLAERLAEEEIDMAAMDSILSLVELEKRLKRHESEKVDADAALNDILLDKESSHLDVLTEEEMDEIMDRSPSCYASGHRQYTNMASFEALSVAEE